MSDEGGDEDYDVEEVVAEPDYGGDNYGGDNYGDQNQYGQGGDGFPNEDPVYEVENQSFCDRICDAIVGIAVGLVLFIGAFPLLWWNEGRAVDAYKAINEGRQIYVPIDSGVVDSRNENKLVYLTGLARPTVNLTDYDFGLEVAGSTKLTRNVEMYQWAEKKTTRKQKNLGGSTTTITEYTYSEKWSSKHIDSSKFMKTG